MCLVMQAPTANDREIKLAYRAAIRQCHPDVMIDRDEASAHDLSIILNDIYAVRESVPPISLMPCSHDTCKVG